MIRSPSSRACSSVDRRPSAVAALLALAPLLAASPRSPDTLLTRPYPIVAYVSFSGGLFHWIDSLAGTSAGKTIPAHRDEFLRRFGPLTPEDQRQLRRFIAARAVHRDRVRSPSAMLGVFCGAASIESALAAVKPELDEDAYADLAAALDWFRPKYERVWSDGAVPRAFLTSLRVDPGLRRLEKILGRMVRFYGVDPKASPPPRIALVPVPDGYGTHAEAIGDVLLLEIRPGESLAEQASVIAHENAHFLWSLVPRERRARLAESARALDTGGSGAWSVFHEAIPTALGQGVADRAFREREWSMEDDWYHTRDVDRCAKRIYPVVRATLDAGDELDEAFLKRALAALQWDRAVTPPAP